jgi:aminoglycoside N3'-acetyltransferase
MPEVGALAELFRRRPGTIVSDNPSGRFGARGARAADLLRDVPWHDYYGPGSPLDRLCAWGGRILRLGANPDTVTALHFAEYLADLPDKRRTRWDYVLAGRGHVWVEALDDSQGIADWDGEDYFALILKAYLAQGCARTGTVGAARAELIDAADIVRFGAQWMEANLSRGG